MALFSPPLQVEGVQDIGSNIGPSTALPQNFQTGSKELTSISRSLPTRLPPARAAIPLGGSPLNTGNITNCSTFHQRYRLRQLHQLNFPLQISFPYDVAIKWEPSNLIQTVSGGAAPHPLPLVGLSAVSRCGFRSQDHTHPAFLFRSVTWRLRLFRQWQLKRPATDQRLILRLTFPVDQLPVSSAF